jgi:hypothetical protein
MHKLAILLIATGGERYTKFVAPLVASLRENFPPHDVILFTDSEEEFGGVTKAPWADLGWPGASLMRYHAFLSQEEALRGYEHLLYLDVDMLACQRVTEEELFSDGITAVIHPGYPGTFERRRESTAYVEGDPAYYQGCLQGGRTDPFLEMCRVLAASIDADKAKGITAVWHDESHLNRYLLDHPPARALTPAYAYPDPRAIRHPERWMTVSPAAFSPKIKHLEKPDQARWKARKNALIAIVTCGQPRYRERLAIQRKTWVPAAEAAGYDVVAFDGEKLGVPDDYLSLPLKTKALCGWALGKGYDSMMKTDDDCYVNVANLAVPREDYAGLFLPRNDCGSVAMGIPPLPNGTIRYDYASGGAYWLSRKAMGMVADAPFYGDWAEDRWVGQVLGKAGIRLKPLPGYLIPPFLDPHRNQVPFQKIISKDTVVVTQLPSAGDMEECHDMLTGRKPFPPRPPAVPPRPVPIIMPVPGPQRPVQVQRPPAQRPTIPQRPVPQRPPAPPPRSDWQSTILGNKVNHAVSRGFRVAAVCPMGSSYHMQLRKTMPEHLEEVVDTPQGKKVLFLVR